MGDSIDYTFFVGQSEGEERRHLENTYSREREKEHSRKKSPPLFYSESCDKDKRQIVTLTKVFGTLIF